MYKKRNLYMLLTLTFIIGFLMSVAFPLTSDDLGWGSIPVQTYLRWKKFNRYFWRWALFWECINYSVTKMQFFLHLLYAGTLTILSYLSTKLTRSTWLSMIIMMGLLWLPKIIVAQTFGWNAGFINYVFALVFRFGY